MCARLSLQSLTMEKHRPPHSPQFSWCTFTVHRIISDASIRVHNKLHLWHVAIQCLALCFRQGHRSSTVLHYETSCAQTLVLSAALYTRNQHNSTGGRRWPQRQREKDDSRPLNVFSVNAELCSCLPQLSGSSISSQEARKKWPDWLLTLPIFLPSFVEKENAY